MNILGISAFYHDSAACLVRDGKIVAAAQEERFTRKKHDESFPARAVAYCLKEGGIAATDLDLVGFYDKPLLTFERLMTTYMAFAPRGFQSFLTAMPVWIKKKLWMRDIIRDNLEGYEGKIHFTEHHESHAASAFFPSPFKEAAILTMDGVGEWATTSLSTGKDNHIRMERELRFPHSLGLLYSAFTYYTGFKVNSGEYKVMGLAPYGEPRYVDLIYKELIDLKEDGSFRLNMDYFNFCTGLTMTSERFHRLFGGPPRSPESDVTQRDMDLARSIQTVCEEVMVRLARHAKERTGASNLCLAGGVALNCVGNGRILREKIFDNIWIQPAAGDAGGALGTALFLWHQYLDKPRAADGKNDSQGASLLGPEFSSDEIEAYLKGENIPYTRVAPEDLACRTADLIAQGHIVGWFQGRMEFGPRALGSRSIFGDPRDPKMQSQMNRKIKYRESFRPFAPMVLRESLTDYFEMDSDSPYMMFVAMVKEERRREEGDGDRKKWGIAKLNVPHSDIPAVTHVDYSARIQTVEKKTNGRTYDLVKAFQEKTGCGLLINTSFNVRGEPIVCRPEEAYRCFMRTELDYLVLGDFLLDKKEQPRKREDDSWKKEYALD